jgi:Cu(I)/Ag(I) efflux system protein CusF
MNYRHLLSRLALLPLLALLAGTTLSATAQNTPKVNGEIRKVDTAAGKVTIHHEDIPNLDMPGMTMVFRASPPTMLNNVKSGDHIQFTADRIDGVLTVTSIQRE